MFFVMKSKQFVSFLTQQRRGNRAAFEKGELPPLEPGAMSYMMSKGAYLTDDDDYNLAHLMFYAPPLDGKAWVPICRNHL